MNDSRHFFWGRVLASASGATAGGLITTVLHGWGAGIAAGVVMFLIAFWWTGIPPKHLLRRAALLVLGERDDYGLGIAQRVGHIFKRSVPAWYLYPILRRLEREGLLLSYDGETASGRKSPRRYYKLTITGWAVVARELETPGGKAP